MSMVTAILIFVLIETLTGFALYKYFGKWYWMSKLYPKTFMIMIHKNYIYFDGEMFSPFYKDKNSEHIYNYLNSCETPTFSLKKTNLNENKIELTKIEKIKYLTTDKHKNTYKVEVRINDQITEVKMCSDKFDLYLGKRKRITLYTNIK